MNSYYQGSVTRKLNVFSLNSLKKINQINRCTHRQNLLCGTVDHGSASFNMRRAIWIVFSRKRKHRKQQMLEDFFAYSLLKSVS